MAQTFDIVVLGAGPAGYVAALRAAQLGMSVACIDRWVGKNGKPAPGGTCLNVGCIPSKALLESSEHFHRLHGELAEHGITTKGVALDVPAMIARKDKIVGALSGGVATLFSKSQVTYIAGKGRLLKGHEIEVTPSEGGATQKVSGKHIIIATGSSPRELESLPFNNTTIVDSSGGLDFTQVPEKLGVIGAGVIGLELGSVWNRLGSKVTMLEAMDSFLPSADEQVAELAQREMTRQGLDIHLGARVLSGQAGKDGVKVVYEDAKGEHSVEFSKLIVAVGRRPNTADLNVADTGLLLDERGFVHVDEYCHTNLPNVYAIGDVVRGPMLAHKGSEEGVMVVERIAGEKTKINYDTIPWIIYTHPEIAWVGKTERQLKAAARDYKIGTFPMSANGRAKAMGDTAGIAKVLADKRTDRILGVHLMCSMASEMIAEAVVAMEFGASTEDLQRTVHAHPSLSEAVHEAALAADGKALHFRR